MEINSAKLPLEGKITLFNVTKHGSRFSGRNVEISISKSGIKDGKLFIRGGKFQVGLTLLTEGSKMNLQGDYDFEELHGTVYLEKK